MKFIINIILIFLPLIAFSQSKDSVIVYHGDGSFNSKITDLSNMNLKKLPMIDLEVEILILDDNNLTEIPNWFVNLRNLKTLSIRNDNI